MSLKDVDDFLGEIGKVIKFIFFACAVALPCIGIYMGLTGQVKKGSGYNRHQKQQQMQAEQNKSREKNKISDEEFKKMLQDMEQQKQQQQREQQYQQRQRSGSPRSHYQELWEDAEYYASLLEENDIDHESLEYPIEYHDLEDLRDEYVYLLDENNIDY